MLTRFSKINTMLKIIKFPCIHIIICIAIINFISTLPLHETFKEELFAQNNCSLCKNISREFKEDCFIFCKQNFSNEAAALSGNKNLRVTKFGILCQELMQFNETVWTKVILTWDFNSDVKEENLTFIVEVTSNQHIWTVVEKTTKRFLEVPFLNLDTKYLFRLNITQLNRTFYSKWIHTLTNSTIISAPRDITVVDFQIKDDSIDAFIKFTPSNYVPCSYDVTCFPLYGGSNIYQETFFMFPENGLIRLPELSFGTNYSLEIVPSNALRLLKVETLFCSFLTPCRYFKGDTLIPDICNSDRPFNLTAKWQNEMKELLITWEMPIALFGKTENFTFSVSVWKDTELPDNKVVYTMLPGNQTQIILRDVAPSKILIIEVFAIVDGFSGQSEIINIIGRTELEHTVPNSDPLWLTVVVSTIAILIILVLIIAFIHKQRYKKSSIKNPGSCVHIPDTLKKYIFPEHKIDIQEKLGQGAFGVVYKGTLTVNGDQEVIAIKKFMHIENMLQEADIMLQLGRHDHIVSIRGICTSFDKVFLLLEYCPLGDLHTWLRKFKLIFESQNTPNVDSYESLPSTQMFEDSLKNISLDTFETSGLLFMYQVALAMEHISSNKLIHRDLAARNVLLYNANIVKLADFGLTRDVYVDAVYVVNETPRLPIRWMAPEALETKTYTLYSDIWSFGVLMWEIMSLGSYPYLNLHNDQLLPALQRGERLEKPDNCCEELYKIMCSCWNKEPKRRSSFNELKQKLELLLDQRKYVQF